MRLIGITGGIGSGKTTVCRIFESMGIPVYYADIEAKKLMNFDKNLKHSIKALLGDEAYHINGRLNRKWVASRIFSDKSLLEKINRLVHPAVKTDVKRWLEELPKKYSYALQEAALLVENGSYKALDGLISVSAPKDLRIQRVVKRDKTTIAAVQSRMNNQLPQEAKDAVADFVIFNDGSKSLILQVWEIHKKLTAGL